MEVKVNWFIPAEHHDYNRMPASVWIRCLQLIPYLRELGIESTVNDPDSGAAVDIIVRMQDDNAYELAKRQKAKGHRLVFDLCVNYLDKDAIEDNDSRLTKKHFKEAYRMAEIADVITCASEVIANTTDKCCGKARYITDSINQAHFNLCKPQEDFNTRKLRAIWSGISSKASELEPILPLLIKHSIDLVVISDAPPKLSISGSLWSKRFNYKFKKWTYKTFPKEIVGGEVCLSHRDVSTRYNQGHSVFKVGVFMAEGVPVLASPQPSYIGLLQGELARAICPLVSDWDRELSFIANNRDYLMHTSKLCKQAIEPYYTHNVAKKYSLLIAEMMEE